MGDQEATSPVRKRLIAGAIALGTVLGAAGIAGAVTAQDSGQEPAPDSGGQPDNGGDEMEEGDDDDSGEHRDGGDAPLTGDIADQVTAAAEAAVPGGTVTKVEQEDDGYEAHVTDVDGSEVEVYFDQDLAVVEIEQGHDD